MSTVTVTLKDGTEEVYRQVPSIERGDHWLMIQYRYETYHVPVSTIRAVRVEAE